MVLKLINDITKSVCITFYSVTLFCLLGLSRVVAQAPLNDQCEQARVIQISQNGFSLGQFVADTVLIDHATIQAGENFAPAIRASGLDKKSVWYKFSLPVNRSVRVMLGRPGGMVGTNEAGFTVFKANSCLPTVSQISSKLTPIASAGNTYHPCIDPADYYVQVSASQNAIGSLNIILQISDSTGALYDHPLTAYDFGSLSLYGAKVDFNTGCLSIKDSSEDCIMQANTPHFSKSAWACFKTRNYFDHVLMTFGGVNGYFSTGNRIRRTVGFRIYKGNCLFQPVSDLPIVHTCDSVSTNGYYLDVREFLCHDLDTSAYYSIQLLFPSDFAEDFRLGLFSTGAAPGKCQLPDLASFAYLGLPMDIVPSYSGTPYSWNDQLGCNNRIDSSSVCLSGFTGTGITTEYGNYSLASYFSFNLLGNAGLELKTTGLSCGPGLLTRVYKKQPVTGCTSLQPDSLVAVIPYNSSVKLDCMESGTYIIQFLGKDDLLPSHQLIYNLPAFTVNKCVRGNLGASFQLQIKAFLQKPQNHFGLYSASDFDQIGDLISGYLQPLLNGVSYASHPDTLACIDNILPYPDALDSGYTKSCYRNFIIPDSGQLELSTLNDSLRYRIFSGWANQHVAGTGNVYPTFINTLNPIHNYLRLNDTCDTKRICLIPGAYTLVTNGKANALRQIDQPAVKYYRELPKGHYPSLPENMGSVLDSVPQSGGIFVSNSIVWPCRDNLQTLQGFNPCSIRGLQPNKMIFREFFLRSAAHLIITENNNNSCLGFQSGTKALFSGRGSQGLANLVLVDSLYNCFRTAQPQEICETLPAGWYTLVSYGVGSSYSNPVVNYGGILKESGFTGYQDQVKLVITPTCAAPRFNRPYKASIDIRTRQPYLLQWYLHAGSDLVHPKTDTLITLAPEFFNCSNDTPFIHHPFVACDSRFTKVVYYVFQTTQRAYIQIDTKGLTGLVYPFDVRRDSSSMLTASPLQSCIQKPGYIQLCNLNPGIFTLMLLGEESNTCTTVAPTIYVDKIDTSRFDFASRAYDFGSINPDSLWHTGKTNDRNPYFPQRAASSDFIYCTTGAFSSDPKMDSCGYLINDRIYSPTGTLVLFDSLNQPPNHDLSRRNLWYSFVIPEGGNVRVKVEDKTPGRFAKFHMSLYASDADPTLSIAQLRQLGEIDSTINQGLKFITSNADSSCVVNSNELQFYRNPCSEQPARYFLIVDNPNNYPGTDFPGLKPNSQIEVHILFDSVIAAPALFDHYFSASEIGVVRPGVMIHGATDNFTCATRTPTDPVFPQGSAAQKTLWYHFTINHTGTIRYRLRINENAVVDFRSVHLLQETISGDSTANGLKLINQSNVRYTDSSGSWGTCCIAPGSYYLLATGLNQRNEFVYPELISFEDRGDFCTAPVNLSLANAGTFTDSAVINCHTTGIDFGEEGPVLSCPLGGNVHDYKSTWFKINVSTSDTLDIRTRIINHTTAGENEISYRLIAGTCGAMQEQSCVQNSQTENTYQCLLPGRSYFVQVFTPVARNGNAVTGNIQLVVMASRHTDTCILPPPCLATANFDYSTSCDPEGRITFYNYATFGSDISYLWQVLGSSLISTSQNPSFTFEPAPDSVWHTIKLKVTNHGCFAEDSITRQIVVPPAPKRLLGTDSLICNSQLVSIYANGWPGTQYLWMDGSRLDRIQVGTSGLFSIKVNSTYGNCRRVDSMQVFIARLQMPGKQNLLLCSNADSVILRAPGNGTVPYSWVDGYIDSIRTVYQTGQYIVQTYDSSCIASDSFIVRDRLFYTDLVDDTTVCYDAFPFRITVKDTLLNQVVWSDNSVGPILLVQDTGLYKVNLLASNCAFMDSIKIKKYNPPTRQRDTFNICAGSSILLPWGMEVNQAGNYADTLRSVAGCDSMIHSATVHVKNKPDLGSNQNRSICQGNFINLSGLFSLSDVDTIRWFRNGIPILSPVVQEAATYEGIAMNSDGCFDSVIVNLVLLQKPEFGPGRVLMGCLGDHLSISGITDLNQIDWFVVYHQDTVRTDSVLLNWNDSLLIYGANQYGCLDTMYNRVQLFPVSNAGRDSIIFSCPLERISLSTPNDSSSFYQWTYLDKFFHRVDSIVTDSGTFYRIATSGDGCRDTAVININYFNQPDAGLNKIDSFCAGIPYLLNTPFSAIVSAVPIYYWEKDHFRIASPVVTNSPGTYVLTVQNSEGCRDSAELTLTMAISPILQVNQPQPVCAPSTINLSDTLFYNSNQTIVQKMFWMDSNCTSPVGNPIQTESGDFYITMMNQAGCQDTGWIHVTIYGKPELILKDTVLVCRDGSAEIHTGLSSLSYPYSVFWYPSDHLIYQNSDYAITNPNPTGLVYLKFQDSVGCNFILTDSVFLITMPTPAVSAGLDLLTARNIPIQLNANGAVHYQWSPVEVILSGEYTSNPWVKPIQDLMMTVTGTDEAGCVGKDSVLIKVMDGTTFYIPSSFTPNNDGLNDRIKIIAPGISQLYRFSIYNRWGEEVFRTANISDQWNGTYKGRALESGTYVYEISGMSIAGRIIIRKGTILLIR